MNLKERIRQHLISGAISFGHSVQEAALKKEINKAIDYFVALERISLSDDERAKLLSELVDEVLGLGPLTPLVSDPNVTEIMVNGPGNVYAERNGRMVLTDIRFEGTRHLMQTIEKIMAPTQRRVDESSPYVDCSLSDGSRVNIILPPLSLIGPVVTIRKFLGEIAAVDDLINRDTMTRQMADFLIACIRAKMNIIFAGATGVGKTTTLNVLSAFISGEERIVTIEDTQELRLRQDHVVPLEARQSNIEGKGEVTIRDLFKNSLRMRPDRIILGEIRGSEALDMLQAISSGHTGSLAVLHASSPRDVVSRIETMILTSNSAIPLWAIRRQMAQAIDLIVMQEQLIDGQRKMTHITEVQSVSAEGDVVLRDLFSYEIQGIDENSKKVVGRWRVHGIVPDFYPRFALSGNPLSQEMFREA
ncbi:MAG: CpaF family protein [Deltaproteobacteria bacterium]